MRKVMFLVVLSIIGAGQLKADPACPTASLAFYVANFGAVATPCDIGTLAFSGFGAAANGFNSSGPASAGGEANLLITPILSGVDGVGLMLTYNSTTVTWTANATGALDAEVPFEVKCLSGTACLTDVFMSLTGTSTGTGTGTDPGNNDLLTETYCLGAAAPPPTAPCAPGGGSTVQNTLVINSSNSGSTQQKTDTFSAVSQLSIAKDAFAGGNGAFPGGTSTITQILDEFSTGPVTTPEPSAVLMLGSGLLGLAVFSIRRRRRSLV